MDCPVCRETLGRPCWSPAQWRVSQAVVKINSWTRNCCKHCDKSGWYYNAAGPSYPYTPPPKDPSPPLSALLSSRQPVNATVSEGASSLAAVSSRYGKAAAAGGKEYRTFLEARNLVLGETGATVPAGTSKAFAMPVGMEMDNTPQDPRLCRAAFRDQLIRAVRYGAITMLKAYDTHQLRKPSGSNKGPAREGAVIERPSKRARWQTTDVTADDAGHLCHNIVFRATIAVADIIHELQSEGIADGVDVQVPDSYRHYNENSAEDAIEAVLCCGGSTWDSPGQVRPRNGQCHQLSWLQITLCN